MLSLLFILVVALLFGTYLAISLGGNYSLATASPSNSCSTKFAYGSSHPIYVLVLRSGSTGKICVKYTNALNNSLSLPTYFKVFQISASANYGGGQFNEVTSNFHLDASASNVSFVQSSEPSGESEFVNYTITAPQNASSGVYGIFLLQFCSLFPIVVAPYGSTPVRLSSSEFSSWYPHHGSCPAQEVTAGVIGVGGFDVLPAD